MKQMAALRVKLNQTDSLFGQRKSTTRKTTSTLGIKDPDLLTEQMLAERWRAARAGRDLRRRGRSRASGGAVVQPRCRPGRVSRGRRGRVR